MILIMYHLYHKIPLVPLTPPMDNQKIATSPTTARLATTMSLMPLSTTTADATTAILTGSYLMTTAMNSTIPPLTTSSSVIK